MTQLKTEYTDVRDVKHQVEHVIVTESDKQSQEQLMEELYSVLTRNSSRIPA